jgi:hypothetical protein
LEPQSVMRADGSLYGEDQGIGHFLPDGKLEFRGSLFYDTSSTGRLSFLKYMVGIFNYEVDHAGKTPAKVWEWK